MPTIVYQYGLRPPTVNASLVDEQMRSAHRYYNTLIEIERDRRSAVAETIALHAPEVEHLEAWLSGIDEDIDATRASIGRARSSARNGSCPDDLRQQTRDLCALASTIRSELRDARKTAREDLDLMAAIGTIHDEVHARRIAARAACGCYWGTYLVVERSAEQAAKSPAEPHFGRWTGAGQVDVQIQHGLDLEDIPEDRRVQIGSATPLEHGRTVGNRRAAKYKTLRLRVGSDGKDPIWAEWPMIYHRPIPAQARIMWVSVCRSMIAGREKWSVNFTLQIPSRHLQEGSLRAKNMPLSVVAVDLGWRQFARGIRVGYCVGSDEMEHEVMLHPEDIAALDRCDGLRSIRDRGLDDMRPALAAWLRARELPEWLRERTSTLHSWRSPARFAALAHQWRQQRWNSDAEGYELLEEWRRQDKHLWQWEANERRTTLDRRRERYRVLAADLAMRYNVLVLEDFDLTTPEISDHPLPEDGTSSVTVLHQHQRRAAPGELRQALINGFARRGGIVAIGECAYTTHDCALCESREDWDQAREVRHRCEQCGSRWDQDANAAENLIARFREHLGADQTPAGARRPKWRVTVTDYSTETVHAEAKWGRKGRHKKNRSQTSVQGMENSAE